MHKNMKACSHKLGKCIAGFSWNGAQNHEGMFRKSYKCIAGFSQNCVQTSLNSVIDEGRIKHPFASLT